MAKNTLPTNYVDDIMNVSANGNRKYRMIYNDDGTVSFEDVTPYEQVGSDYSAIDINTTNEAVNESFDKNKIVPDLTTINALTEQGYVPDALAVKQLNESLGYKDYSITIDSSFAYGSFTSNLIRLYPKSCIAKVWIDINITTEIPAYTEITVGTISDWNFGRIDIIAYCRKSNDNFAFVIKQDGTVIMLSHKQITNAQWAFTRGVFGSTHN